MYTLFILQFTKFANSNILIVGINIQIVHGPLAQNPSVFKGFVKGQCIRQAINTVDPILMNAFKLDDFKGV